MIYDINEIHSDGHLELSKYDLYLTEVDSRVKDLSVSRYAFYVELKDKSEYENVSQYFKDLNDSSYENLEGYLGEIYSHVEFNAITGEILGFSDCGYSSDKEDAEFYCLDGTSCMCSIGCLSYSKEDLEKIAEYLPTLRERILTQNVPDMNIEFEDDYDYETYEDYQSNEEIER